LSFAVAALSVLDFNTAENILQQTTILSMVITFLVTGMFFQLAALNLKVIK